MNETARESARCFEEAFWSLYQKINIEEDLRPLNLDEEVSSYLDAVSKGLSVRAPQFRYREPYGQKHLPELAKLKGEIGNVEVDLQSRYLQLIENLERWIVRFSSKEEGFGKWLYELYGSPDSTVVDYATSFLKACDVNGDEDEGIDTADPVAYFEDILSSYGYKNWTFVCQSMPAKIRISAIEKTIYIDSKSKFSESTLHRLSKHEIGTHVLRYENGLLNDRMILRYGMPEYLETEEGLALYSEELNGLLSDDDMRKYCLRVLASHLAATSGFNEVFSELCKFTSVNISPSGAVQP